MPKKKILSPDDIEAVAAQRKRGTTFKALAKQWSCSVGTIASALKEARGETGSRNRPPQARGPKRKRKRKKPAPIAGAEPVKPPHPTQITEVGEDDADLVAGLRKQAADIQLMVSEAKVRGDEGAVASHHRNYNSTVALIAKLTPPPSTNPDDNPDMVAAAARVRRKLHELMSRVLDERAEASS